VCKRYYEFSPTEGLVVKLYERFQSILFLHILEKSVSSGFTLQIANLVEQKIEFGDLSVLAEDLQEGILINGRM